jgi:hypothetical protein
VRPKPLFGEPCNRCGLCCSIGPCATAQALLELEPDSGQCPMLLPDLLGGYICGLTTSPVLTEAERAAARIAIGAGIGCDMRLTGADLVARSKARARMTLEARQARRDASPEVEAVLRHWRLAPP